MVDEVDIDRDLNIDKKVDVVIHERADRFMAFVRPHDDDILVDDLRLARDECGPSSGDEVDD